MCNGNVAGLTLAALLVGGCFTTSTSVEDHKVVDVLSDEFETVYFADASGRCGSCRSGWKKQDAAQLFPPLLGKAQNSFSTAPHSVGDGLD